MENSRVNLSRNFLKNSSYSFFGYVFPIVFSILITPVIVRKLGVADYGIYVLINTIMGFLNLADLGLGMAVVKYAAEYHARRDFEQLKKLFYSANLIFLLFGMFGFLVFVVLGKFFLPIFHIGQQAQVYNFTAFALGGIIFFLNALGSVVLNAPKALQRYDLSVKIGIIQLTLFNVLSLVLVLLGYKLRPILLANILVTSTGIFAFWIVFKKILPGFSWKFAWDKQEVIKSYRFGLAAFVTNISNNTLAQLDRVVVPMYMSPAQLSYYSLPGNVAEKINGVTGSATGILFPMLSSLSAVADKEKIKSIYNKIFRNLMVISAAMAFSVAFLSQKIMLYWLGEDFALKSASILIILAVTNGILAVYSVLQNFLLGFGKVRFLMKASIFMAMLNVVCLILLVPKYGINGAAWAYLISVLPIFWFIGWVEKNFLELQGRLRFYVLLFLKVGVVAGLVFGLVYYIISPLITSMISLVILGPLTVVVFLVLFRILGFVHAEDLQIYRNFYLAIKTKIFG